ncbi:MAG: hypothetical protein IPO80_07640 [Propionibacteriaceae bacterium]|nr:hypothetical protein [Propionibacteriaceae bacterium]
MSSGNLTGTVSGTTARPFWRYVAILLMWQMAGVAFGAVEAIYKQPAPVVAIVATIITVAGWVVLGVWSGRRHRSQFRWVTAVTWLTIIVIMVLTMFTVHLEADGSSMPWTGPLMVLTFFAAVPLNGIASYLPLDQSVAVIIVAVGILAVSVASFYVGRRFPRDDHRPSD